jgi:ribosomal-protein-alanine N-acetyltransferase
MVWICEDAKESDLDVLEEIERVCFSPPLSREMLERELDLPQSCLRVLRYSDPLGQQSEKIAGLCLGWSIADQYEIHQIAVLPAYRHQGLGSQLMRDAFAIAKTHFAQSIYLEVRASNRQAIQLYRSFSFTQIGIRPAYYSEPTEDALIFAYYHQLLQNSR